MVASVAGPFLSTGGGSHSLELQLESRVGCSRPFSETELEVLSWSLRSMTIRLPCADPRGVSAAVARAIFKVLSHHRGLLLHAACLIRDERAYLFVGRSGAGKTTLARNASGYKYVHDDTVAIRRRHGRWWAYGIPTLDNSGRPGANTAAKVGGLYLTEKSSGLRLSPLCRKAALRALPAHVIVPVSDPVAYRCLIDTLFSLVVDVDVQRLRFRRDSDVADIL
jgi:hypothetical protein